MSENMFDSERETVVSLPCELFDKDYPPYPKIAPRIPFRSCGFAKEYMLTFELLKDGAENTISRVISEGWHPFVFGVPASNFNKSAIHDFFGKLSLSIKDSDSFLVRVRGKEILFTPDLIRGVLHLPVVPVRRNYRQVWGLRDTWKAEKWTHKAFRKFFGKDWNPSKACHAYQLNPGFRAWKRFLHSRVFPWSPDVGEVTRHEALLLLAIVTPGVSIDWGKEIFDSIKTFFALAPSGSPIPFITVFEGICYDLPVSVFDASYPDVMM